MTKLRRYGIIFLVLLTALMCAPMAMATTEISDFNGLKDAFSAGGKDYKLAADITVTEELKTSKDVVLDLNGHVISTDKMIHVGDTVDTTKRGTAGSLVLNNTSATVGEIRIIGTEKHGNCIQVNGDWTQPAESRTNIPSTLTINKGVKITSTGWYCVSVFGKGATLNVNDAELQAGLDLASVAIRGRGNPWDNGTTINITGGVFTAGNIYKEEEPGNGSGLVIYHPQSGDLRISGGTFTAYDGIQMKAGNLTMTGGTVTAQGAMPTPIANHNGSVGIGAALSLVTCSAYTGDINVNISDGVKLESTGLGSYAIFEKIIEKSPESEATKLKSFNISEGTFTGIAGALSFDNFANINAAITGGIYSSDPTEYVAEGYVAVQDGEMWRVEPKTVTVTPASVDLVLGIKDTETLAASSNVKEGKVFEWASSSGDIVSVDETGKITALKASAEPVTITAALKGTDLKGTCIVTVREAGDVVVTPAEIALNIGGMETLTATCDQGETIRWSSAEEAIATVDEKGNVTGVAKGETDIIATGISSGKSGKCHVVVSEKPVTPPIEPIKPVLPVVSDDVKEEVKPVVGATETDTAEAAAKLDGITEDMLEIDKDEIVAVKADTVVKVVENIATLENVTSADVLPLPVFTAKVESKKTVMISFSLAGADLRAAKPEDVKVLKVLGADSGRLFKYASDITADMDEKFTIQKVDGTIFKGAIEGSETYILSIFIKDGGAFDLDEADGSVADPAAILATKTVEPHHSSSSGCNAGFAGLLLLAAVPFIYRRKR